MDDEYTTYLSQEHYDIFVAELNKPPKYIKGLADLLKRVSTIPTNATRTLRQIDLGNTRS
jgi:uncharacterized protein (DUF1778 family)